MASPPPTGALGRLADLAFRRRGRVIVAWILGLVLAVVLGSAFGGDLSADYATPGSQSERAATLLGERFENRSEDVVDVVWSSPRGAADPAVAREVDKVLADAAALPGFVDAAPTVSRDAEISPNGNVGVVRLSLDRRPDVIPVTSGEELREMAQASPGGVQMAVNGGFVPGIEEEGEVSSELVGLVVALFVLLLTFGTLTAAGLPIATALFGLGISGSLIGVLAALTDVPDWAPQVGAMMGLGVGIDYALLVLTRVRAGTARGLPMREAVVEAGATAGRSVLVAGSTVVISLAGLFLVGLPYLYGVAIASMISVLIVVLAALTLLPALLGVLGRRVERLRIPGARRAASSASAEGGALAARWARSVQRRPALAAALAAVALLAMTIPVAGIRIGFPDAGNDARDTTTRQAFDMLAAGFGPGSNGPLVLIASTPSDQSRAAVAAVVRDVADERGVASVSPVTVNPAGDTSLVSIAPRTSPQSEKTADLVDALRDGPIAAARGVTPLLGGQTAATVDQSAATLSRLPVFILGVVGLSFLLLLAAFRAPVVALKAGVMNLLSIGAAYGVVALLADGGFFGGLIGISEATPIPPFIPVMMFAILFGLSMDYEVFLLSRIREALGSAVSGRSVEEATSEAVVEGIARTARVITAAAAIMVAVFGAFALSPEPFLKLIGVGLAAAILVDATIVRLVLAPAAMQLLGRRNWWLPKWLDRALPRFELERPEPSPSPAA